MGFTTSDAIEVKRVRGKGQGVFARRPILGGELIERVPLIVLPIGDVMRGPDDWTALGCYCFESSEGAVSIALGFGSLYNHSFRPNARYDDEGRRAKVFTALRDIAPGEEITVNYNGDPDDPTPVWFEVLEPGPRPPSSRSRRASLASVPEGRDPR